MNSVAHRFVPSIVSSTAIVMRLADILFIYLQVRHMIPLSVGLLVERDTSGEFGIGGLPTLFSLLHPMSDLCPISLKHSPAFCKEYGHVVLIFYRLVYP